MSEKFSDSDNLKSFLNFVSYDLKQHASRFMLLFIKIFKMYLKISKYGEVNKESNLHIANCTNIPRK
jgi:hypothetical protein